MTEITRKQDKIKEDLKERLNHAKVLSRRTIADISRKFGVTHAGVTKWFKLGQIAKHRISELAEYLECDPVWLATGVGEYKKTNTSQEPDLFLIECTRLVIGLSQGKNISDDEQNKKIIEIYKEGFSTKSINPKLITDLLNMVN